MEGGGGGGGEEVATISPYLSYSASPAKTLLNWFPTIVNFFLYANSTVVKILCLAKQFNFFWIVFPPWLIWAYFNYKVSCVHSDLSFIAPFSLFWRQILFSIVHILLFILLLLGKASIEKNVFKQASPV